MKPYEPKPVYSPGVFVTSPEIERLHWLKRLARNNGDVSEVDRISALLQAERVNVIATWCRSGWSYEDRRRLSEALT